MVKKVPNCPICGKQPKVEQCAPYEGPMPVPWHAGCWNWQHPYHYIGCNGDNRADAYENWRAEVIKHLQSVGLEVS